VVARSVLGNTMPGHQSFFYVFTINNYNDDEVQRVKEIKCRAIKAGFEVGESGTPHIQGAIYLDKKKTLKGLKDALGGRAHVEKARGTWEQQDYCLKDGEVLRHEGEPPKQGARVDLQLVKQDIDEGMGEHELWDVHFETMVRYGRALKEYLDIKRRYAFRTEMAQGVWIYGPSGVGKSHEAFRDFDPHKTYVKCLDDEWWDGYEGQETVIFNEFRGEVGFSRMLDLTDKHPCWVKRRGREPTPFMAKKIVVTCPMCPGEVYQKAKDNDTLYQLERRFEIIHMTKRKRDDDAE
jgi:hypothetical protein